MKKLLTVLLLAASSLVLAGTNEGYLVDVNNNIVKSGTGLCWHTGYWTPANAVEGCDPVAKAAPVSSKITLNADMLFAFDRAELTAEGRQTLDRIAVNSKTINLEVVSVIGYTDRIGSDQYNTKLSQRRADTVRQYLQSRGIATDKIVTEGRGKANSVTGTACAGTKVTQKLIQCLQPDRRAVLEIIGTTK
jgi:OOP family OmpA-OmpF porin